MQKFQLLIALTLITFTSVETAFSQQAVAAGRFDLRKTEHGFLRFDRKTGKVDFCNRNNLVWRCKNINQHEIVDQGRAGNSTPLTRYLTISSHATGAMLERFLRFADQVNRRFLIH